MYITILNSDTFLNALKTVLVEALYKKNKGGLFLDFYKQIITRFSQSKYS